MRILHIITNAELGGAQSVVRELSAWAVRAGHEVAVASEAEGPLWDSLDPGVERLRLPHMVKQISPANDLSVFAEIRRAIREFRPGILHLHSSKAGVLGRLAAGRLAPRTIYTVHGFDTILKAHRSFLPLERALQHFCGAVVAVSEYDKRNLIANGITRRVRVIHNGVRDWRGVEPAREDFAASMDEARKEGGAVLCIARLASPKRFDLFMAAASALPRAGFFWIGNEACPGSRVPENVRLLGSLPDAGAYANHVDLLALFSDYEGLPMSILEALSCGTPVVASAVGGVPEALGEDGGAAVPNDAVAVASAISRYLPGGDRHRGASPRFREAARLRYEGRFSARAMANAYGELYRELDSVPGSSAIVRADRA